MVYNAIGVMSGSSLDGLDIVAVSFTEMRGVWTYEILAAKCEEYSQEMTYKLRNCTKGSLEDYLMFHTEYGRYLGNKINKFIDQNKLSHKIHIIGSHGHTVFHNPQMNTSTQIGDGASIAALTKIATVTDLRNKDVALGGQGAPIVPIAEQYLWSDYGYCLNIGGIANVTINIDNPVAFDIAPANQVLNYFSLLKGKPYDQDGAMAREGKFDIEVLAQLNQLEYYNIEPPKSLANSYSEKLIQLLLHLSPEDALATMSEHIAIQLKKSIENSPSKNNKLLITGGGAWNLFLIERIKHHLIEMEVVIPDALTLNYKEAIAMAVIGVLRWREEENVLHSVTGAQENSVGGALWI